MILSFFVFLIISLSILFGMSSFIIGFHNGLPSESFDKQTNFASFRIDALKSSTNKEAKDISGSYLNNETEKIIESYLPKDINIDNFVNQYHGNASSFINTYPVLKKELEKNWSNYNLISYVLYKDYFSVKPEYTQNQVWNLNGIYRENISSLIQNKYFLFNKRSENINTPLNGAKYETKQYVDNNNVLFLSPRAENKYSYKLGQNVIISIAGKKQSFIYGGQASLPITVDRVTNNNEYYFYLVNYIPKNEENNFNLINEFNENVFYFRNPKSNLNSSDQISWWNNISQSYWLTAKGNDNQVLGWNTVGSLSTVHMIYIALLSLVIVFGIIMILLDIVIAWFLIKEIIKNLSTELLFLKALGMTNKEVSLINATTLGIILGCGVCLSIVGMLGIQSLFIFLSTKLVDIFLTWSHIQNYSLIVIFGALLFLLIAYFVSSLIMLHNLKPSNTEMNSNNSFRFSGLRNWLFSRSANSGLTFAFSMKNLNKIIVTFVITLLITTLSFISLGFRSSISEGHKKQNAISFNQDNMSYADGFNYINKEGIVDADKGIKYSSEQLSKGKEISSDDLKKVRQEWFLKEIQSKN